ncbi:hypothetical protein BC937DRAFT_89727 [Endogone sp. FLAS-F59071]|nr:hypothetical protein BC937DRAFT_89727 [Endogone sp. FLAS-F59071]|eukprot:RUS23257.1 hypothetical protein BC937DRAFT_89727 [Endogone sp. FLAS-F59071]
MDPYDLTQPSSSDQIQDDFHNDEDALKQLEKDLAPKPLDFYGVLNVSRTATEEEIKDSYKKLCLVFHPDKVSSGIFPFQRLKRRETLLQNCAAPDKKKAAEAHFQVIKKAYEALTNRGKRIIYDLYGEEGLQTSWEVGPKLKTPEEMRAEYEHQARLKREQELENLVRSKGEFHVNVDASPVFDPYEGPTSSSSHRRLRGLTSSLARTEIQQLYMKHSFETQLAPQTVGNIAGSMLARNGVGGGNVIGTVRHTFSPKLWAEAGTSLMAPRILHLKGFYQVDADTFLNVVTQSTTIYAPPTMTFTAGRRLGTTITGYLTCRTGEWGLGPWGKDPRFRREKSAVVVGIGGSGKRSTYSAEIQTGILTSYISFEYNYRLIDSTRIRLASSISTAGGLSLSLGSEHRVTEHSRLGVAMECGVPSGVTLKFRFSRLGQKIVVPVILSQDFNPYLAFWAVVLPASIAVIADQVIVKPRRNRRIADKIKELREEHAEFIANRRREAEEAQQLLQDSARRKLDVEKAKDGLVIIEAIYGNLSNLRDAALVDEYPPVVDVTIAVQAMVNNSKLTIPGGHSKYNIMGFYDPCMGERKKLRIKYRFQRSLHEVTVEDTAPVACPLRSHVIDDRE